MTKWGLIFDLSAKEREVKKLEIALEVFQEKVSELDEENILLNERIAIKDEEINKIKKGV